MRKFYWRTMVICTLMMCLGTAVRAAEVVEVGSAGANVNWTLYDDGLLRISGTGAMDDYEEEYQPWVDYANDIERVIVEEGVTRVGNHAFDLYPGLTEVTVADSVLSIGYRAFAECELLADIDLPGYMTSIGSRAFCCCISLESIEIPNGITLIEDGTFEFCDTLSYVGLPDSLENIDDYAFFCCVMLESITIPNKVTHIGESAFESCDALTGVYYIGTAEGWNGITIEIGNDALDSAPVLIKPTGLTPVRAEISGDKCMLQIKIESGRGVSGYLLIGIYESTGRFIGAGSAAADLTNIESVTVPLEVSFEGTPHTYKAFFWDSVAGMKPLCAAEEYELNLE